MIIGPDSRPRRRDGVVAQEASGTLVLLEVTGGHYFSLNEVGSRVWGLCDGRRTVSEITTGICDEFDAPEDVIGDDVVELLGGLVDERLVEIDP